MTDFSRGSVERAARDALAERISQDGALEPFAVATDRVKEWSGTPEGRSRIASLAREKVRRGPKAFGGDDPRGDYEDTRAALRHYRARNPSRSPFRRLFGGRGRRFGRL